MLGFIDCLFILPEYQSFGWISALCHLSEFHMRLLALTKNKIKSHRKGDRGYEKGNPSVRVDVSK